MLPEAVSKWLLAIDELVVPVSTSDLTVETVDQGLNLSDRWSADFQESNSRSSIASVVSPTAETASCATSQLVQLVVEPNQFPPTRTRCLSKGQRATSI